MHLTKYEPRDNGTAAGDCIGPHHLYTRAPQFAQSIEAVRIAPTSVEWTYLFSGKISDTRSQGKMCMVESGRKKCVQVSAGCTAGLDLTRPGRYCIARVDAHKFTSTELCMLVDSYSS